MLILLFCFSCVVASVCCLVGSIPQLSCFVCFVFELLFPPAGRFFIVFHCFPRLGVLFVFPVGFFFLQLILSVPS